MAGGGAQTGEVQLLFYLALYVIIASLLLSLFATAMHSTTGMVNPVLPNDISNGNDLISILTLFTGLLLWVVPATIIPLEIQIVFIVFPKLCIASLCVILLTRLIP